MIILVEQDVNLRQSIALILERAGYTVTATGSINQAMSLLHSVNFKLILADSDIPETRQVLIPQVTRLDSVTVVILADQLPVGVEGALPKNLHYLVKPLAPEQLLEFIQRVLGKHGISLQLNSTHLSSSPTDTR